MNLANSATTAGVITMGASVHSGGNAGLYKFQPINSNPPAISSVGSINSSSDGGTMPPSVPLQPPPTIPPQYLGGGTGNLNHTALTSSDETKANGRLQTLPSLSLNASSSFSPRGVSPNPPHLIQHRIQSGPLMTSERRRNPAQDNVQHQPIIANTTATAPLSNNANVFTVGPMSNNNTNTTPEHLKQTFTLDFWTRPKPGGSLKKGSLTRDGSLDTNSEENLCLQGDIESETTLEDGKQRDKYSNSDEVSRGLFDANCLLFGDIDDMTGGGGPERVTTGNTQDTEVEQVDMQSSSSGGIASPEGGAGSGGVAGVGTQQFLPALGAECCKQSIEHVSKSYTGTYWLLSNIPSNSSIFPHWSTGSTVYHRCIFTIFENNISSVSIFKSHFGVIVKFPAILLLKADHNEWIRAALFQLRQKRRCTSSSLGYFR